LLQGWYSHYAKRSAKKKKRWKGVGVIGDPEGVRGKDNGRNASRATFRGKYEKIVKKPQTTQHKKPSGKGVETRKNKA